MPCPHTGCLLLWRGMSCRTCPGPQTGCCSANALSPRGGGQAFLSAVTQLVTQAAALRGREPQAPNPGPGLQPCGVQQCGMLRPPASNHIIFCSRQVIARTTKIGNQTFSLYLDNFPHVLFNSSLPIEEAVNSSALMNSYDNHYSYKPGRAGKFRGCCTRLRSGELQHQPRPRPHPRPLLPFPWGMLSHEKTE